MANCAVEDGVDFPCSHERIVSMLACRLIAACACVSLRRFLQALSLLGMLFVSFIGAILASSSSIARTILEKSRRP